MQSLKYNSFVYSHTRVIYQRKASGSVWNKHKKPNAKKMKTRYLIKKTIRIRIDIPRVAKKKL